MENATVALHASLGESLEERKHIDRNKEGVTDMHIQPFTVRMWGLGGDEGNRTKNNGFLKEMLQENTKNGMDTES